MAYKGIVSYSDNNESVEYTREGFASVEDATKWVSDKFAWLMLNWARINEDGIEVFGEVCDDYDFCDLYSLRCGL